MRPTDFCHLNDTCVYPYLARSRLLRGFHRVLAPRSLGLRAAYQGTGCFTTPENASADRKWTRAAFASPPCFLSAERSVGVFFPRRPLQSSL